MKTPGNIIYEITPLSDKDCFYIADRRKTAFTYPIHHHAEYELNFIENAPGVKRMVGDSTEVIGPYDLVLITGKELEHTWQQHQCSSGNIREITIQFSGDLFPEKLLRKNQFETIRHMFEAARSGISFPLPTIMKVYSLLDTLSNEQSGFTAVIQFMNLLHELSLCPDPKILSSSSFARTEITSDSRRIRKVQHYIATHYKEEIRLREIAGIAGMTPISFSRFFKLHTGRTLSDYIIDIRLGIAARLLADTHMNISEIVYECGFNNLSNFNRLFLKKKQYTPKLFRETYRKKKIIV